jgi:hypothetical protein
LPTIKIDLDLDSFRRLSELAVEERRPIPWQAEILLLRALAVPVDGEAPGRDTCAERQVQERACCAAE